MLKVGNNLHLIIPLLGMEAEKKRKLTHTCTIPSGQQKSRYRLTAIILDVYRGQRD